MGMSLVIMKEEKHRKHTICCESRFISNGIFLNIFHETWIIGLEGATEGHGLCSLGSSTIPMAFWTEDFSFLGQMKVYKELIVREKRILAINMNSFLCLSSGINRGQLQASPIIFISLSGLRCWQCSLPSCPHMPSFYLGCFSAPCKTLSQNKYHISFKCLVCLLREDHSRPFWPFSVPGGAGRGSTACYHLVICANLSLALELDGIQLWQETVYPLPYPPATQPDSDYWLDPWLALALHQMWWLFF